MWKIFGNIGAIFGVAGVSLTYFIDKAYESHLAVAIILIACLLMLWYVYRAVKDWQRQVYARGYRPISTFVRYSTTDGKSITHETFRLIQVKHTFLVGIDHRYSWSGTKPAKISSQLQSVGDERFDAPTGFHVRSIRFEKPRFYNETEVVHIRSECDDSDEQSSTHVSLLIDLPVTLVQFRVELLHCTKSTHGGMKACVERRLQTSSHQNYEKICDVTFDINTRSFEYLLKHPEAGYAYRMRWDRPALAVARRKKNGNTP